MKYVRSVRFEQVRTLFSKIPQRPELRTGTDNLSPNGNQNRNRTVSSVLAVQSEPLVRDWTSATLVFCLILTICPVTHYDLFSMILDSFGYLHTPWRWSTKPFTKQLSRRGGKWICISCFLPYTHHLPSHSVSSIFHDLRLVRIPSHYVKTLHKTVYEMAKPLWR